MSSEGKSNIFIDVTYWLFGALAVVNLIPMDFPFHHNHGHIPRYVSDDHDVCRASGWLFAMLLAWYFILVVMLFKNSHAFEQTWAQRLLIYPNLAVGVLGLIAIIVLFSSYSYHSEDGFATTMGFLNGMMLTVISLYCYTLVKYPLADGFKYAWSMLAYTTGAFLVVLLIASFYEKQWYMVSIAGIILVPFALGFSDAKKWAIKDPYKI